MKIIDKGETVTAQEDGVFLPYWYWEKIFDYIVDTQEINGKVTIRMEDEK